jgi:hypothetical protein
MSPHTSLDDGLRTAQSCVGELTHTVGRLAHHALRAASPTAGAAAVVHPETATIPDKPYDHGLWSDVDEEGVGAKDRHAP